MFGLSLLKCFFPSASDRWFPAPVGEGKGVGSVILGKGDISKHVWIKNTVPTPAPPLQGRGIFNQTSILSFQYLCV